MGPKPLSKPPLGQPYTKKREVGVNSTQRALPSLSLPQRLGTGLPTDLTEGSSGPSLWRHVTAGQPCRGFLLPLEAREGGCPGRWP